VYTRAKRCDLDTEVSYEQKDAHLVGAVGCGLDVEGGRQVNNETQMDEAPYPTAPQFLAVCTYFRLSVFS
jgi:hypothetical protein